MTDAADLAIDRDRWKRHALGLAATLDGSGDDHDPLLWRIWQARAKAVEAELDAMGTRLAITDRAARAMHKVSTPLLTDDQLAHVRAWLNLPKDDQ